jgi:peptide/nickel transport system permease protein
VAQWLARRVAASIAIVFAVVTLSFFLIHLAPGRPFCESGNLPIDPEVCDEQRRLLGLDDSLHVQYVKYLAAVARGHLGYSYSQRRPVSEGLADAIPNTMLLAGAALFLDFLLGITIGVYQALHRNRLRDVALTQITLFLFSVPTFWLGYALIVVFAVWLGWFPAGGIRDFASGLPPIVDVLWHLVLPATTMGIIAAAGTARYQRAAMLEAMEQGFVRTARAKGSSEFRVVMRHALRNALLPSITLFGLTFPFLLTGAVLVEFIFSWPGMGWLTARAMAAHDYPLLTALAMVAGIMVTLGTLIADVLYAFADPRIRLENR